MCEGLQYSYPKGRILSSICRDDFHKIWTVYIRKALSEVSCENCTHTAIAAKKKGCYTQRDSGGVWTTPEMSGQGSHWDTKGIYEGENTAVI